jgi:Tat protein secretion system quality control protein TatD with DNase activity
MKGVLIFLGTLAAVLVLTCIGLRYFLGVRFELRKATMGTHENRKDSAPLGVVRVIASGSSEKVATESVGIHAYNEIYAAIGVHPQDFERWENAHGMYSSGIDASGKMLAPGYPIFSKVASMYIDPVTLTSAETAALVQECQQAIRNSASESAKHELEAISSLAEKALSKSAVVQFGHP